MTNEQNQHNQHNQQGQHNQPYPTPTSNTSTAQSEQFTTLIEKQATLNGKDFRVTLTLNNKSKAYTVSIREFIATDRYTGYSKYNGVTLPTQNADTGIILVNQLFETLTNTTDPMRVVGGTFA